MLAFSTTHPAKAMPSSAADNNAIKTIGGVAGNLKVTVRSIFRPACAKKILSFNVGGRWCISKADIDRWIREQSSGAADESGD